jgi:hypothetical protein
MGYCVVVAVCGWALSWSITTPRLSMQHHLFHFVFIRKHLWHPAWTQFSKTKFIRHNFVKKWPWNLWKMQGKWQNGKSSVLLNLLFHCTYQIFINHRPSAAPQIIMHIFPSFIKVSRPCPYHRITHVMFSIHLTKLWWMSAGFMPLASEKWITERISYAAGFLIFLNIVNTQDNA